MMNQSLTDPLVFSEEDVEGGGKEGRSSGLQNDFAYHNNVHNASVKIRMAFIRKVYGLLSMQLFMTVIIAAVFCLVDPIELYVANNGWLVMTFFLATFVLLIALHFKRRDHPTNLILLAGFTVVQACLIGIVVSFYDVLLVLEALFITLTVVIALTAYTFQTKHDFSAMYSGLFSCLFILMIGGLLQIAIPSSFMEQLLCIGGAMLFSFFIVFDTQLLMENLSPEEYILATINIYLDIINLFLNILRLLAAYQNS
ncbi:protein lifeguard 4-like [Phymastichus coffea]|uniref:protein lifeguard 4-like n=1 Tax=Phymastichus coffea TaxID=108790 RepID=UPI00273BBA5D|nr:protein lifeguard 4-like [Phymastichus coffea]XP_058794122.1 protein lifeguard 4-like [Phymastichus coffea]